MTTRCGHCRHWHQRLGAQGACRRYAPRPDLSDCPAHPDDPPWRAIWPLTLADDGCGDFAPLPVTQTPRIP